MANEGLAWSKQPASGTIILFALIIAGWGPTLDKAAQVPLYDKWNLIRACTFWGMENLEDLLCLYVFKALPGSLEWTIGGLGGKSSNTVGDCCPPLRRHWMQIKIETHRRLNNGSTSLTVSLSLRLPLYNLLLLYFTAVNLQNFVFIYVRLYFAEYIKSNLPWVHLMIH